MDDLRKATRKSDQSSTTSDALDLFDDEPTGGTTPMSPGQRFLVALLLLVTVVVIGVTFLLVTQRIWLR